LRADRTRTNHYAAPPTAEIPWRLPPATRRVGRPSKRREHELFGSKAAREGGGEVSVIEAEAITARFERRDGGHLGDLMATRRNDERQLSRAVQDKAPVVKRAGPEHRAIGVQDPLPREGDDIGRQPTNFTGPRGQAGGRTTPSPSPSPSGATVASRWAGRRHRWVK